MANMPAAEVELNETLVTQLLREQHPDLAHLPVHTVANGWDNSIFRLGKDLVIRLPRRKASVPLIRNEQKFLAQFSQLTSVNLPIPVRLGVPSDSFGWPWSIACWFEGVPAIRSTPHEHSGLVEGLAEFLCAIYRPAPSNAPRNPVRGVPLRQRDRAFRDRVSRFARYPEIIALWQSTLELPEWQREPFWLHGDLHPANILMLKGRISAIIDFGDICAGDPATDLAAGWMLFKHSDRQRFKSLMEQQIGSEPELWQRARGWALNLATVMVSQSDDRPELHAMGCRTLRAVLDEPEP